MKQVNREKGRKKTKTGSVEQNMTQEERTLQNKTGNEKKEKSNHDISLSSKYTQNGSKRKPRWRQTLCHLEISKQ